MNEHPFTYTGLGKSPFTVHGDSDGNHSFFCEHCGRTLKNRFFVKSADNKISVVGFTCIKKTNDKKLIEELAEAKSLALKSAKKEKVDACIEREKSIFDGQTKSEKLQTLLSEKQNSFNSLNRELEEHPVSDIMDSHTNGNFFLHNDSSINELSPRTIGYIKNAIVKSKSNGARKNSKAYKNALPLADAELNSFVEMFNGWAVKINLISAEISEIANTNI